MRVRRRSRTRTPDLNVVLPFTDLHPHTARTANLYLPGHRKVWLNPAAPTEYARLLRELWAARETFVVVEHDVVVHHTVLPDFDECPQPWCGFVYDMPGGVVDAALGCTRFREELLTGEPDVMAVVSAKADDLPAGHWAHLDAHLRTVLESRGYTLHRHTPSVVHLHHYSEA